MRSDPSDFKKDTACHGDIGLVLGKCQQDRYDISKGNTYSHALFVLLLYPMIISVRTVAPSAEICGSRHKPHL